MTEERKVVQNTNIAMVSGVIEAEFIFSHQYLWENFYRTRICVERTSGTVDFIPLIVSEIILRDYASLKGRFVRVSGQFRSYNLRTENGSRLDLFLFVTQMEVIEKSLHQKIGENIMYFDGYICKPPILRETPKGRVISDFLIAINRTCRKSDYIPCIAWGRTAQWISTQEVGTHLELWGRMQSRGYVKMLDVGETEERTAYEVSVAGANRM